MTWTCIACGRPITLTPAVSILTKSGPLSMGPKCARKAGLIRPAAPRVPVQVVRGSIGQADLFNELMGV